MAYLRSFKEPFRVKQLNAALSKSDQKGSVTQLNSKLFRCIRKPDPLSLCAPQVIVEKVSGSQIVDIDKRKYLVPSDITVAQFMWIIRKRIQLPSEKAIFLFVDKTVPQSR